MPQPFNVHRDIAHNAVRRFEQAVDSQRMDFWVEGDQVGEGPHERRAPRRIGEAVSLLWRACDDAAPLPEKGSAQGERRQVRRNRVKSNFR